MTTSDDLMAALGRLDGQVARARHDLASGAILDLSPLERQVSELCAGIRGLPAEQARPFASRLLALFTELEALGDQIKQGRDALAAELGELGKRRSAVSAYGRGS